MLRDAASAPPPHPLGQVRTLGELLQPRLPGAPAHERAGGGRGSRLVGEQGLVQLLHGRAHGRDHHVRGLRARHHVTREQARALGRKGERDGARCLASVALAGGCGLAAVPRAHSALAWPRAATAGRRLWTGEQASRAASEHARIAAVARGAGWRGRARACRAAPCPSPCCAARAARRCAAPSSPRRRTPRARPPRAQASRAAPAAPPRATCPRPCREPGALQAGRAGTKEPHGSSWALPRMACFGHGLMAARRLRGQGWGGAPLACGGRVKVCRRWRRAAHLARAAAAARGWRGACRGRRALRAACPRPSPRAAAAAGDGGGGGGGGGGGARRACPRLRGTQDPAATRAERSLATSSARHVVCCWRTPNVESFRGAALPDCATAAKETPSRTRGREGRCAGGRGQAAPRRAVRHAHVQRSQVLAVQPRRHACTRRAREGAAPRMHAPAAQARRSRARSPYAQSTQPPRWQAQAGATPVSVASRLGVCGLLPRRGRDLARSQPASPSLEMVRSTMLCASTATTWAWWPSRPVSPACGLTPWITTLRPHPTKCAHASTPRTPNLRPDAPPRLAAAMVHQGERRKRRAAAGTPRGWQRRRARVAGRGQERTIRPSWAATQTPRCRRLASWSRRRARWAWRRARRRLASRSGRRAGPSRRHRRARRRAAARRRGCVAAAAGRATSRAGASFLSRRCVEAVLRRRVVGCALAHTPGRSASWSAPRRGRPRPSRR